MSGRSLRDLRRVVRYSWAQLADWTVDHLLGQGVQALPAPFRERFAEEWADHRSHYRGWRLLWWALCVRVTTTRTRRKLDGFPRRPGRATRMLAAAACWLLPASHRARYAAEFHSELAELAGRHRLAHAIRILRNAPATRASIRATTVAEREG